MVQSKSNRQNTQTPVESTENNEETYEPLRAINVSERASPNIPHANMPCIQADEFHLFGQTVAEQLRQLPLETALETEEMILAIIRKRRVEIANRLNETNLETDDLEVKMEDYWCESPFGAGEP